MTRKRATLAALVIAAAGACAPAAAQVRVMVDGQLQEVPDGVVRTISYSPGGRQTIHDELFDGAAQPGAATVTTEETTEEDDRGRAIGTTVVTRIEPMRAVAYAEPAQQVADATPAPDAPGPASPEVRQAAFQPAEPERDEPRELRIRRDPETGHFIAAIKINGVEIRAIVDTGAASTILSPRDAWNTGAGREIVSSQRMVGIGGFTTLNIASVHSLEVAGQQFGGFSAAIGQDGLAYTLLGQTEIARLGRIVIEDGTMTIAPRHARMASR